MPAMADNLDVASIPTGAVYVCVVGSGQDRTVRTIELQEKVAALCAISTCPWLLQKGSMYRVPRKRGKCRYLTPDKRHHIWANA